MRSSSALEKLDGARVGQREPVTGRGTSFDCLRKDKIKGPRASFSHRRKSPWNASLARGHFIGLRYGDFIDRGAEDVESTYYLHAASSLSLSWRRSKYLLQHNSLDSRRFERDPFSCGYITLWRRVRSSTSGRVGPLALAPLELKGQTSHMDFLFLSFSFFFLSCKNFDTEYSFW